MMRIAFVGCSKDLPKVLVLHLMKVRSGALKVTDWDEAEIGVIGDAAADPAALRVDGKQWIIMAGECTSREGTTIRLPKTDWQQRLIQVVEGIVLGKSVEQPSLNAHTIGKKFPVVGKPAADGLGADSANKVKARNVMAGVGTVAASSGGDLPPQSADEHHARDTEDSSDASADQVFNPADYPMLELLRKSDGKHLAIIFDQQRSLRIIGEIALSRVSKTALKALCQAKDSQSWRIEDIRAKQTEGLLREAVVSDVVERIPVDKLRWDIAHFISGGRRSASFGREQLYSLRHFPDFNRVEAKDSYIRMAAMLFNRPVTAAALSRFAEVKLAEVYDFLFALEVGSFLGDNNQRGIKANTANTGVFSKLMSKFSLGRS